MGSLQERQREIAGLIAAAMRLPSSDSLQPRTYATLISLLAATGLRISEALHLLVSDITPNGLLIRRTKFQKTRLVPLHDTAVVGLGHFLAHRQEIGLRWRSCLRCRRRATARVREGSPYVPEVVEISGAQTLGRSVATHS